MKKKMLRLINLLLLTCISMQVPIYADTYTTEKNEEAQLEEAAMPTIRHNIRTEDFEVQPEISETGALILPEGVDSFVVDFYFENADSFNSFTANLDYNSDVIRAVEAVMPESTEYSKYITYNYYGDRLFFPSAAKLNKQINLVPAAYDETYDGLNPDGVKTAAQLGRIRLSEYIILGATSNGLLNTNAKDGILFSMRFKVLKPGAAKISLNPTDISKYVKVNGKGGNVKIKPDIIPLYVYTNISEEFPLLEAKERLAEVNMHGGTSVGGYTRVYNVTDETLSADFDIVNNKGILAADFYISYNPEVIRPIQALDNNRLLQFTSGSAIEYFVDLDVVNERMKYKPGIDDLDYADLGADGVKEASQLGKIIFSADIGDNTPISDDGTLCNILFEIVGTGSSDLKLVLTSMETENGLLSEEALLSQMGIIYACDFAGVTTMEVVTEATTAATEATTKVPEPTTTVTEATTAASETTTAVNTETLTSEKNQENSEEYSEGTTADLSSSAYFVQPQNCVKSGNYTYTCDINDEYLIVDYRLVNNPGINSITLLTDYDPNVIQPVAALDPGDEAVKYAFYDTNANFMQPYMVEGQLSYTPDIYDDDYFMLGADGEKTAAELGRIKVASFISVADDDGNLLQIKDDGILFRLKFKILSKGSTDINIIDITTTSGDDFKNYDMEIQKATVFISDLESEGIHKYQYGDANLDGKLQSDDVTLILNYVLDNSSTKFSKNQKLLSAVEYNTTDVDADSVVISVASVTATYARVLDNSYPYPNGGDYVYLKISDSV